MLNHWRDLIDTDAQGLLAEDALCRRCAYSLRTQSLDAACPECATLVYLSLHPDLLRFSEPNWVRRLARGTLLLVTGLLFGVVAHALMQFGLTLFPIANQTSNDLALVGLLAVAVTADTLALSGVWLLTSPEPRPIAPLHNSLLRHLLRSVYAASICVGLAWRVFFLVHFFSTVFVNYNGQLDAITNTLLHTTRAVSVAVPLLLIQHLRALAQRFPDDRLRRHSVIVMIGLTIPTAVLLVFSLLIEAGTLNMPQAQTAMALLFGLPMLVFSIWLIVLLFQYRRRFLRAAQTGATSRARLQKRITA